METSLTCQCHRHHLLRHQQTPYLTAASITFCRGMILNHAVMWTAIGRTSLSDWSHLTSSLECVNNLWVHGEKTDYFMLRWLQYCKSGLLSFRSKQCIFQTPLNIWYSTDTNTQWWSDGSYQLYTCIALNTQWHTTSVSCNSTLKASLGTCTHSGPIAALDLHSVRTVVMYNFHF